MCNWDPCSVPPIFTQEVQLAQLTSEVGVGDSADLGFLCINPSVKLHLTLEAYVQPGLQGAGVGPAAHVYTNETWQLYAQARTKASTDADLNPIFYSPTAPATPQARPLPDSYEGETGVKQVRGVVHVAPAGGNQEGEIYIVRAIWEPYDSAMSTEERAYWFKLCQIRGDSLDPAQVHVAES